MSEQNIEEKTEVAPDDHEFTRQDAASTTCETQECNEPGCLITVMGSKCHKHYELENDPWNYEHIKERDYFGCRKYVYDSNRCGNHFGK